MNFEKNKEHIVTIVDYTADGLGVAKVDGRVIFVTGAAKGDVCRVLIMKVTKSIAYGKVTKIIQPSPDRIPSACPTSRLCGGCCFWHIKYEEELAFKQRKVEQALQRIGGIDLKAEAVHGSTEITGYRNKAQYPVGRVEGKAVTGFFRKNSHDIVPIERCLIQTENSDKVAATVRQWMDDFSILPYDEKQQKGFIRHVYVRSGKKSGQILVTLVVTRSKIFHTDMLVERLRENIPGLCGVLLNINSENTNQVLGRHNICLWGKDELEDTLCGKHFTISPFSFYQVNHGQAERLYDSAIEFAGLTGKERVIDLYSGAGTISLAMAEKAAQVIGVDIVPEAVENAKQNAEKNGVTNVEFICGDAGVIAKQLHEEGRDPQVLIVDPPRKGLEGGSVEAILAFAPQRIVYVSCDPATLARDVKIFSQKGYTAQRLQIFDLFPRSAHVECVVLLTQNAK